MSWTNRWDVYGGNEDESINPFDRRSDTENNYDEEGNLITYYSKANIFSSRTERDDTVEPGVLYRHLDEEDDEEEVKEDKEILVEKNEEVVVEKSEIKNNVKEELQNQKRVLEEKLLKINGPIGLKKILIYCIIIIMTIEGSINLLSSMPLLQLLIPSLVAMTIPVVYGSIQANKSMKIEEEINNIDEKIKVAVCDEIKENAKKYNKQESLSQAIDVDIFHRHEPFNGKEKFGKPHFQHKGYSDESCLEKITSDRYKAAGSCKDIRERNRKEAQKRLVKRLKK